MKRFFDSRWGLATRLVLIALLVPVLLVALLCLIPVNDFWFSAQYIFFLFCGPGVAAALLLILTNIKDDLSFGFGTALYYGTMVIAYLIGEIGWQMPAWDRIILGFIISALVCYIIWLEKFK